MRKLKQNTARTVYIFVTDASNPQVGLPGLTLTLTVGKGGAAVSTTPGASQSSLGNGWYALGLTTTDTNTVGDLALRATADGANETNVILGEVQALIDSDIATAIAALDTALIADRGTAQAGGAAQTTLATTASTVDGSYRGMTLAIISGTGANQAREIVGYTGATRIALHPLAWNVQPDATSVYVVCRASDLSYLFEIAVLIYGAVDSVEGRIPAALVGGRMDASVDTGGLATDAVAEIADGVWDESRVGHQTPNTMGVTQGRIRRV